MAFSEQKFRSLPEKQQHKKCAELIRSAYEAYMQMQEWIEPPKDLADLYHKHLKLAGQSLKEHNLLPENRESERGEPEPLWPIALYLDNIRSAHNVGSIIRTIEGLSFGRIYLSGSTPGPEHPQVKQTAMGAADWIEAKRCEEFALLPRPLIALETAPDAKPLHQFIFPETFTLAIGNEEYGCSDATLEAADAVVAIPMRGRKNSLNVANAFAMAAAEIMRQRT